MVHLQPGASRDEVAGKELRADGNTVLRVRVRAVPEKGKANAALVKLLAKSLGLPKSSLEVISGPKSRVKTVLIRGDSKTLSGRVKEIL